MINLLHGDCLEQMKTLEDNSVDSIVSDPPYGISFMAKKWDYDVPSVDVWNEAMRVLKPGGHALIACGTRTQHRMVVNIEDAGFEIRDVVSWIYGSGFPKSLNISKAIDKNGGNGHLANEIAQQLKNARTSRGLSQKKADDLFCGGTTNYSWYEGRPAGQRIPNEETFKKIALEWSELKSLQEKVAEAEREVVGKSAHKSGIANGTKGHNTVGGTIAQHVEITTPATEAAKQWDGWGTALKPACEFFTLCRKPLSEKTIAANVLKWGTGGINIDACRVGTETTFTTRGKTQTGAGGWKTVGHDEPQRKQNPQGRFPANLIHDGSKEVLDLFPDTKTNPAYGTKHDGSIWGSGKGQAVTIAASQGSAARFFYCPKASKKDRNEGNNHPTVKPTALMAYLCRLITPTGGVVLDPYMGSGSTGKAAVQEGFRFVGCELDKDYFDIATARVTNGQDLEVRGDNF
jgi:DNA modification methylase